MADVVVLIDDLFFLAKLQETAKLTGTTMESTSTTAQLLRAAAASPSALVIVDLNVRHGALDAVEQVCKASQPGNPRQVIAFLSHIQAELAERARAAGCQDVMPRSKFTQHLPAILRGAKS